MDRGHAGAPRQASAPGRHDGDEHQQRHFEPGSPARSTFRERLVIALCDELALFKWDEFIWHNPSKAPGPIQWASRTQQQLNVAWEPVYIFTNDPHRCVASNRRVLQTHTAKQIELIRTGAVAQEGASVMVPIAAKKAHSGGLRRGEFRETSNPLRMVADVISCSGGFLSACWFDVIARMVAVTVPNAAFERLLAARSGLLFPEPERLLKAGCGHSFLVTELLHDLGSGHSPVSSASDCLCI